MEKKQRNIVIAIVVVAIVIIAGIGVAVLYKPSNNSKTIYWITVAPINQEAVLKAGTAQGAVGWEPYSSAALLDGNANLLTWSEDVWPNHPCCVLAVKYDSHFPDNATNEDLIARIVRANMDASNWLIQTAATHDQNYTALLQMGAKFSSTPSFPISQAMVADALNHTGYSNDITPQVKGWFVNFTNMFASLNQLNSFGGYSNASNYVNAMINTTYLQKALLVQPSNTILNPKQAVNVGYLNGDLHQFARVIAMNKTLWGGKTLFEKYGVNITSPAAFAGGAAEMNSGFALGIINIGYLGAPPALLLRANSNILVQIVSLVNTEGSAILGDKAITSFDQLVGQTVATPGPGSIQHLLLSYYCQQKGYTLKLKGT